MFVKFLMALRDDFEGLHGIILYCSPIPSVDVVVVNELLVEEIRLKSNFGSDKGIISTPPSVFVAPFNKNFQAPSSHVVVVPGASTSTTKTTSQVVDLA